MLQFLKRLRMNRRISGASHQDDVSARHSVDRQFLTKNGVIVNLRERNLV